MLELRLRPRARRDLDDIWDYTAKQWSPAQANRYVLEIRDAVTRLRTDPHLGRPVEGAVFLKSACRSHVIFFWVDDSVLEVVRILHARMDFNSHLPTQDQ